MKKILLVIISMVLLCGCNVSSRERTRNKNIARSFKTAATEYQYYYDKLDENAKKVYQTMYLAIKGVKDVVKIDSNDKDVVAECSSGIYLDHPELFWYQGSYSLDIYNGDNGSQINFNYTKTAEEIPGIQNLLDKKTKEILASIGEHKSRFETVEAVYDYVINNCSYDESANDNQNLLSSLLYGKSVCAGYSKAIQYLLNKEGISATSMIGDAKTVLIGSSENTLHEWNMVKLDGGFYYIDATWGDQNEISPHACSAYLLFDSTDMLANYKPQGDYEKSISEKDTYFRHNDIYLEKYDEDKIYSIVRSAIDSKTGVVELKGNQDTYNSLKTNLIGGSRIYDIFSNLGIEVDTLRYVDRSELNFIEIYF